MSCRRDNLCIVSANRTRQMVLQYQKFFLLNLYPLCGLRIFCWLNQSLKTRGRGHSQHSLTPHMRARSTTTTSSTWLSPTQEAERLTGWRTNWMGIVYGKPAGISEPRYYKIRWMSVFLDMRNMLNCINLYRFGVWPLIHCLKICKKLLYDNYILKIILLDTNFPLKIWRIKLEISLLINPN